MTNYKIIDLNNWSRKEHFEFFSSLDDPFFSVVTKVEVTNAFNICKELKVKFFAYYLFNCCKALNKIDELKSRIVDNKVVKFDTIHVSSTIGREDGSFGFSFVEYEDDIYKFENKLNAEIERVRGSSGLAFSKDTGRLDVFHFSPLPWFEFSSLKNSRNISSKDSIPKISVGKVFSLNEKKYFNLAADLHHGLADGFHFAKFLNLFEKLLNERS